VKREMVTALALTLVGITIILMGIADISQAIAINKLTARVAALEAKP
jgi:hypothetical protein